MNKKINIILIFIFLIFFSSFIFSAVSLFSAQEISKKYLSENERVDVFSQQPITCEKANYYVIPVLNSLDEISFFVPIEIKTSKPFLSKDLEKNKKLFKTGYVLREISYSSSKNYLTTQLIDKITKVNSQLKSNKTNLEGLLDASYASGLKPEIRNSINSLDILINNLNNLKTNLKNLIESKNEFVSNPNCKDTVSFISSFSSSFSEYDSLTQNLLNYQNNIDALRKKTISSQDINDSKKSLIISYITLSNNISSTINLIYDSVSSTNEYFSDIEKKVLGVGENKIETYIQNFRSRKDYIKAKNSLYEYDSYFSSYDNLDSVIKTILNPDYINKWKDQENVKDIKALYSQINQAYSSANYKEVITKSKQIKEKAKEVLDKGFVEEEKETNKFVYIFLGAIILTIIILIVFNKIKNKKKNKPKKEKDFKDLEKDPIKNPFDEF